MNKRPAKLASDQEVNNLIAHLHSHGRETTQDEVRRFLAGCRKHHCAGFGWEPDESLIIDKILAGKALWVMTLHVWFGDSLK